MRRYQVIDLIGAGGSGTVYRVMDRLTGERVALKRIERMGGVSVIGTDPGVLQSLTHEFNLLAGLRHPHIIHVLDYGFDGDQHPYFTMELLENAQTIVEAAQVLPFDDRLALFGQLVEALAYLHRRGILHRDLKPANVLVVGRMTRVLDFGLASMGSSVGEFTGTLAYMPPEMLRDHSYVLASDLYVAGALAVEMFAGHRPFPSGDMLAILSQPPDLTGVDEPRLRAVIERLLRRDPAERFADAESVLAALAEIDPAVTLEQTAIRESYLQAAPFIGREVEFGRLEELLRRALAGTGQAALIGGESGIGKSRLLNELRIRALTLGARVYVGQAAVGGGARQQLWRDLLAHLVIDSDPDQLTDLEAGILKAVLPEIDRLLGRSIPLAPEVDGNADTQRLAYTIVTLIQRLDQPVMLLLEDLQWGGEALLVLEVICRSAEWLPLLVVGSYRTDDAPELPSRLRSMKRFPLERFSAAQTQALCVAMIGALAENGSGGELIRRLQRESDGNAFFLVEMLRALAEQSAGLRRVSSAKLPEVLFPAGMMEIIQRRLAFVPEWAQPLLKLAAVAGRQIDLTLLGLIAPDVDLEAWLYACAAAGVVEVYDNQWRFAHDKLREVLLLALAADERAALHRQVAEGFEGLYGAMPIWSAALAEHWMSAGEIERGLIYTLRAVDYLRRIGGYAEMRVLVERGVQALQPTHPLGWQVQLWSLKGEAYLYGDTRTAQAAYEQALSLLTSDDQRADHRRALIDALRGLAIISREQGQRERAAQLIGQIVEYAEAEHDRYSWISGLMLRARSLLQEGSYQAAETSYEQALGAAKGIRNQFSSATLLMNLGAVACMQGKFETGRGYFDEAERLARSIGAVDIVVYCQLNLANLASDQGDYAAAESYFEACTPMIEALGEVRLLGSAYYDRGDLALRQSKLDDAWKWYQRGGQLAERLNNHRQLCDCLHGLGKVAYLRHEYEAARGYFEESQRYADELHLVPEQVVNLSYAARALLRLGETEAAFTALVEGLHLAQQVDGSLSRLEMLVAAIEGLLFTGDFVQAALLWGLSRYHPEMLLGAHGAQLEEYYRQFAFEFEADELDELIGQGQALDLGQVVEGLMAYEWR